MALIKCKECGKEISTDAKACPHCGAKPPYRPGIGMIVFAGLALIIAIKGLLHESPPIPPKTEAEKVADEAKERRYLVTVITAKKLKTMMREPDSVEWMEMWANEQADTVCLKYRSRNGFGGMNVEIMTVTKQEVSQDTAAWNAHCISEMYDMLYARHAL